MNMMAANKNGDVLLTSPEYSFGPHPIRHPADPKGSSAGYIDPATLAVKTDHALNQGKQCVIVTLPHTRSWMELVANLPDKDVARLNFLTTKSLNATALCGRIPTIPTRSLSLFMCHG
jgi:hypothetical protein